MLNKLRDYIQNHRAEIYLLLRLFTHSDKKLFLKSDIMNLYINFCSSREEKQEQEDGMLMDLFSKAEVAVVNYPWIFFSIRQDIAEWKYLRFHAEDVSFSEEDVKEYLKFEERIVEPDLNESNYIVNLDFKPFNRGFPTMREKRSIGRGVEFLNRHLSNLLFSRNGEGHQKLFDFLRLHQYQNKQLMLNDRIENIEIFQKRLNKVVKMLEREDDECEWTAIEHTMQELGFEAGWGRTVGQIRKKINRLQDIFEAPDPASLEIFLSGIPMIFNLVILSPHGYFSQSNVLGLPDTGGQVVYILDQVRALEKEMRRQIYEQGLEIEPKIIVLTRLIPDAGETSCNQEEEEIIGTKNSKIVRIPFRNRSGKIINHWISRFDIWPYLEQFSIDAEKAVLADIKERPDLIIGNYSDGNLVATLMANRLKITQCNIAHALEKTKYLFSALHWKQNDEQYHFSSQFTADLIAMNAADFIITSTYQEIAGTPKSVGQYESYSSFTMPDLYRVVDGINVYDPKFNIVSPGCDQDVYFPYFEKEKRPLALKSEIEEMIYGDDQNRARGVLSDKEKPLIFTIARLDHIKNITGLVEWYAKNDELRATANLFIISGFVNLEDSGDEEERYQIQKMYNLIEQYNLHDHLRWHEKESDKSFVGELYRYVADKGGIFVQPALFEAFGLTVIEAMSSGLPTFATRFGGPLEIIVDGISGFHIDPNNGAESSTKVNEFFKKCKQDKQHWEKISRNAISRVEERFTWKLYANRLLTLSRIYGFWKYVTDLEREETQRYIEMFYGLMYKQLVSKIPEE